MGGQAHRRSRFIWCTPDGAVGAALVGQAGGQVLVQNPAEAAFASMPRSALAAAPGARAVPLRQLVQQIRDSVDVARSLPSDPVVDEARIGPDVDVVVSDSSTSVA